MNTRTCTIHLSVPGSVRVSRHSFPVTTRKPLNANLNAALKSFASRHGISTLAVDYEVTWNG